MILIQAQVIATQITLRLRQESSVFTEKRFPMTLARKNIELQIQCDFYESTIKAKQAQNKRALKNYEGIPQNQALTTSLHYLVVYSFDK